jgi:hypothetical protein
MRGDGFVAFAVKSQDDYACAMRDALRAGAGGDHGLQGRELSFGDNDLGSLPWHGATPSFRDIGATGGLSQLLPLHGIASLPGCTSASQVQLAIELRLAGTIVLNDRSRELTEAIDDRAKILNKHAITPACHYEL